MISLYLIFSIDRDLMPNGGQKYAGFKSYDLQKILRNQFEQGSMQG